jgi:hypothetical protein
MHCSCLLPLNYYSYSPSYKGAKEQLAQGELFLEEQDIVVMFCAQTMEGGHTEKGNVDNYLLEICVGSQCLRSNHDITQRRYKAGFMGSGSVDRIEENLEKASTICDDTIDSPIDCMWLF